MHTTHSDGQETPGEIINLARNAGVNVISITDHDVVSAVEEAIKKGKEQGVKVIPGVEISTGYNGKLLHILGYNINPKNKELKELLEKINQHQKNHLITQIPALNETLRKAGKKTVKPERYENKDIRYYSFPGIARFLQEEGIIEEVKDGFQYLSGIKGKVPGVTPQEAFSAIHSAGGKAFLSHPLAPKISLKNITQDKKEQEKIILGFKEEGLDGLECYQASHSKEDTEFLLSLCEKHGLLISGGSDWHGEIEKTGESIRNYIPYYIKKFGDLYIPEKDVKKILSWIEK